METANHTDAIIDDLIAKDALFAEDCAYAEHAVEALEEVRRLVVGTELEDKITEVITVCELLSKKISSL